MGTAMAYAFAAPIVVSLLVFAALGLGLALPFLLIAFVPALAARLPKPGAWMETLKQVLAFPMYLTAVWLAWVFGHQRGLDALAALMAAGVALAGALWWWERQRFAGGRLRKWFAGVLVALALAAAMFAAQLAPAPLATAATSGTTAYSAAGLATLRAANKPVLVNMTADWCLTCKVNEKAVFATDRFHSLLATTGTTYVVGDWTNTDPEITAFLESWHSPGVPLYVVFPAGGGAGRQLPQLLTPDLVERELRAAAAGQ
jgi:thiol:disulfide interchange protein DsbD